MIKLADYVAKRLSEETDAVFVGNGSSVLHILSSFKKIKSIKVIPSQNEQGASLAADGYSRAKKNKMGIVVTTSGPGSINAFQGIASSFYDSIPSIYICGAPEIKHIKKNNSKIRQLGFQEMRMVDIVKPFTKYATIIKNPNDIFSEIEKCISITKSGRPGPCLIELPDDLQRTFIKEKKIKKEKIKIKRMTEFKKLKKFKELLNKSNKPLAIIGYGARISNAEKDILKFCKINNIPFTLTWPVADLANNNDTLFSGSFGAYATEYGNLAVQEADLLIIVGCRLNPTHIGGNSKLFNPKAKKIKIDIDVNELKEENKVKINLKINSDCKIFFKNLNKIKIRLKNNSNFWIKKINEYKKKYPVVSSSYNKEKNFVNPYIFFDRLSKKIHKKTFIINDTSCNMVWMHQTFQFKKNQKVFSAYNHSPMGYSVAASIGYHLASPKSQIISIIGDGGMQMNIQELENIKNFNIPVKIFLFNNNSLGMVKQAMDTWFKSNYVACNPQSDLSFPNYNKVAKSYGVKTIEINDNSEIERGIQNTLMYEKAVLCNIRISPEAKMSPKVKLGSPIHVMEYLK